MSRKKIKLDESGQGDVTCLEASGICSSSSSLVDIIEASTFPMCSTIGDNDGQPTPGELFPPLPVPGPVVVHPLHNHVILKKVLKLLQVEDLKSCRRVCKFWDDLATPFMLSQGDISVDSENVEKLVELVTWMNSHFWFPGSSALKTKKKFFTNIICDKITHKSYPNLAGVLGLHVKRFTVSHWWNDERDLLLEDYEHLLLHQCPNLEELNVPCTRNFKIAKDFLLCAVIRDNRTFLKLKSLVLCGEAKPSPKFWRIINISPELETLKIYCQLSEEFWDPFPARKVFNDRMRNLKTLEVKQFANDSVTDDSGNYFLSRKYSLTSITTESYIVADVVCRICFAHVGETLETLNLTLFNKQYDPWVLDRINEGILSPGLEVLKHYKISIDDHCRGEIFCRNLLNSVLVPNLVSLRMIPYDIVCHDEWPNGLFAQMLKDCFDETKGRPLPRKPLLRILTLPPKFQDVSCMQRVLDIYPNIQELEIDTPTPAVVMTIFRSWSQLERLKMILFDDSNFCWTSILTGGPCGEESCCVTGQDLSQGSLSLASLSKLASLEISLTATDKPFERDTEEDLQLPFTDNLIHNGLAKLPYAQNIVITGHRFSPEAVKALKSSVLMFCHIQLTP